MSATKYDALINQLECPVGQSLYASAMDMRADIEKQRANAATAIRALSADLAAAIAQAQTAAVPDGFVLVRDVGTRGGSRATDAPCTTWDAYTNGWNDCRIAMLSAARGLKDE